MKPANATRSKRSKTTRIVLVDDHPMFREGLIEVLGRENDLAVCGEAADRHEALRVIETGKPDLAIVDLSLHDSSGLELIKDIKAQFPKVAVLVVSMHEESLYAARALQAGARGYLTKQRATRHLVDAIRRVANGEIVASEELTQMVLSLVAGRRPAEAIASLPKLSDRELEVLQLIGQGFNNHQISERLHVDTSTVDTYRARIKEKLNLKDSTELLQYAIRWVHKGA